jgi:hypothetical protein
MLQEGRSAVQMKAAGSASSDGQVLQDLGLQRSAKPLGLPDPIVLGGGLGDVSAQWSALVLSVITSPVL